MKKLFTFLVISLFFASCSSDDDSTPSGGSDQYANLVVGNWQAKTDEGNLYETFSFTKNNLTYKEFYTGNNTWFSAEYTIDKDSIYVDFMKISYKYQIQGNALTLTSKEGKHILIKS